MPVPRVRLAYVRTPQRGGRARVEATIGDRICLRGNTVGHADKHGEIVEVHGDKGEPPYLVRFEDGQTRLMFPGPDAVIEHVPRQRSAK
jgi:ribosomal protein L35AE/L33A